MVDPGFLKGLGKGGSYIIQKIATRLSIVALSCSMSKFAVGREA